MKKEKEGGFIYKILLIVVALVLLKYFLNFDIIEFLSRPEVKNFFAEIWNFIKTIYSTYIVSRI